MAHEEILTALSRRFAVDGVSFEAGQGGLPRVDVGTSQAQAAVYLHGAHLTHWQPTGHQPVLWMSGRSWFADGAPIRGGVPICFPWFGPHADDPEAPAHGLARTRSWNLTGIKRTADAQIVLELQTLIDKLAATYTLTIGTTLTMNLLVRNADDRPRSFEAALHTYLALSDCRKVTIEGLDGATYVDKVAGGTRRVQHGPITFTGETDRVYVNTTATCVLDDPDLSRRIFVEKHGSQATVVWNPWIAKAANLPDFGEHEWPGMCCIETANVGPHAVTLGPDQTHAMTALLRVEPR